ncbi:MAG: lytic murein transglycosylase [Parashewanella sp.]
MKTIGFLGVALFALHFSAQAEQNDFKTCVAKLKQTAKTQGITETTIQQTLDRVKPKPKVVKLDKNQPEFTNTFERYFNKRVNHWRISKGKRLWKSHRVFLDKLTKQYGVPGQYILAFWGLETNFGGYKGKMPVIDSLVTLACKPRRAKFFTKELMQALKLKQVNKLSYDKMVGSWAGAMGHTQFMPSTYVQYAVDADGDGVADLWGSTKDALASAANYLHKLGWQPSQRWGREVKLPANFDYSLANAKQPLSLLEWQQKGIKKANGSKLSIANMKAKLYLPAGHTGPAFLAYDNFNIIMRWNRSKFYAISVGHLADRIVGATPLVVQPPKQPRLKRSSIKSMQTQLAKLGYNVGKPDGILGSNTIKAIQGFQKSKNLIADGFPDPSTFRALNIKL